MCSTAQGVSGSDVLSGTGGTGEVWHNQFQKKSADFAKKGAREWPQMPKRMAQAHLQVAGLRHPSINESPQSVEVMHSIFSARNSLSPT